MLVMGVGAPPEAPVAAQDEGTILRGTWGVPWKLAGKAGARGDGQVTFLRAQGTRADAIRRSRNLLRTCGEGGSRQWARAAGARQQPHAAAGGWPRAGAHSGASLRLQLPGRRVAGNRLWSAGEGPGLAEGMREQPVVSQVLVSLLSHQPCALRAHRRGSQLEGKVRLEPARTWSVLALKGEWPRAGQVPSASS